MLDLRDPAADAAPAPVLERTEPGAVPTAAKRLLSNSSIELTTNGREAIEAAAGHLAPATRVYVPKMPRETLHDKLVQLALLRELGLEPVPHVVARQLASANELSRFIAEAAGALGVRRVLVLGGDRQDTGGPFGDSAAVIRSGLLQAAGVDHIDVAGYPDGHPNIPDDILRADLDDKFDMAQRGGFTFSVVTQFSFAPNRVAEFCRRVARQAPGVEVIAGMAGPTSAARLLRYARICGVTTSLRAASSLGLNAVRLAANSKPDRQLDYLAQVTDNAEVGGLAGVHLFSFGGFVESARWLAGRLAA